MILAGGRGTRLWPISRETKPKQFQKFLSAKTLLQEAFLRLRPAFPAKDFFVVTHRDYAAETQRQLPQIPKKNIIIEPVGRNTAAAIGLGAIHLVKRGFGNEAITVLPADHHIADAKKFADMLKWGEKKIRKDWLGAIAANPTYPETGYGYIKLGKNLGDGVFRVEKFIEKPDLETAQKFLASWDYLWNTGIFLWRTNTILAKIKKHLPQHHKYLSEISRALGTKDEAEALAKNYSQIKDISIDYGIMEKEKNIFVIPADLGWSDIGSWLHLKKSLQKSANENVTRGRCLNINSRDSLIFGGQRLIATVGVDNLIVVDTDDALLICSADESQKIKELIKKLKERNETQKYL